MQTPEQDQERERDQQRREAEAKVARVLRLRPEEVLYLGECAECHGPQYRVPMRVNFFERHEVHRPECEAGQRGLTMEDPGRCPNCLGRHAGGCPYDDVMTEGDRQAGLNVVMPLRKEH